MNVRNLLEIYVGVRKKLENINVYFAAPRLDMCIAVANEKVKILSQVLVFSLNVCTYMISAN